MARKDRGSVGRDGEDLAARWYVDHGYEVLDRNWRCSLGEIDLVCRSSDTVVICEVKARSSDDFGAPEEAVTVAKQRRLRRLAERWLSSRRAGRRTVRFDVALVRGPAIVVMENAF